MRKVRPKKYGTPNLLNIEWTQNDKIVEKWKKMENIPIRLSANTEKQANNNRALIIDWTQKNKTVKVQLQNYEGP